MRNNPVLYNDPTGHREDLGNIGNQRSVDCRNYPDYCNGNKPKSSEELLGLRDKDSTSQKKDCNGLGCILDRSKDDDVTFINNEPQKHPFITEMEAYSAAGDLAGGAMLASLSAYAIIATCSLAGPACLITAPIFFATGVFGLQASYNGFQTIRARLDPTVKPPTGREIVDRVFPFLRREKYTYGKFHDAHNIYCASYWPCSAGPSSLLQENKA